jgi:tRNA G10  N-methylase Trm11
MARRILKPSGKGKTPGNQSAVNGFGAQSPWSSLLVERERLESEIKHAKMFLEQIRKDVVSSKDDVRGKEVHRRKIAGRSMPAVVRSALDKHTLEKSALMWLDCLHARLANITADAENLLAEGEQQPESPEELLFTLLRGAG